MPEEVIYHVEHHAEITFGFKRDYEQVQLPRNGLGYFAGSFPDGLTTIKGVPSRPSRARGLKPCKPNYCDVTTLRHIAHVTTWHLNSTIRYGCIRTLYYNRHIV